MAGAAMALGGGSGAASAIAGAGGGIIGSAISGGMAKKEAKRHRKWTEYMRSTAYQATMKDMRRAGLNPILAYGKGPTSSGPGGMARYPDLGASLSSGLRAGTEAAQTGSKKAQQRGAAAQSTSAAEVNRMTADNLKFQKEVVLPAMAHQAREAGNVSAYKGRVIELGIPKAEALSDYYKTGPGRASAVGGDMGAGGMWKAGGSLTGAALGGIGELFKRVPKQLEAPPSWNRKK